MAETSVPEVLWAQRSDEKKEDKNYLFVTISVPDVSEKDLKLDIQPTSLTFSGTSATLKRKYHVSLEFFKEIVPEKSKTFHTAKNIELKLQKKELEAEYWPRLLKDKQKLHFLKTDFDKWVDEDEQDESNMTRISDPRDMPGFGGGDFGGIDFSKLGGGGELPDDLGPLGKKVDLDSLGLDNDSDDEGEDEGEMPALEPEKK